MKKTPSPPQGAYPAGCQHAGLVSRAPFSVSAAGFEKPSAIQQRAIKQIIKGRDVIAQ